MGLTGRANQWTHTKPKLHWPCRGSSAVLSGRTQSCTHETCVQDAVAATMANAQSAAAATAKPGERPRLLALPVSPVTAVSTAPYDTILAVCEEANHLAQKQAFLGSWPEWASFSPRWRHAAAHPHRASLPSTTMPRPAVRIFAPDLLLKHPACSAQAWSSHGRTTHARPDDVT